MRSDEEQELYEDCVRLYEEKGQAAVMKLGEKKDLPFHECVPCECETPHLSDGTCLVCGSHNDQFN